jgi:hypothetical protein
MEILMARTALFAPAHRILGKLFTGAGATAYPVGAAPSLDYLGHGMQDHRLRWDTAGSETGFQAIGWWQGGPVTLINQVPSTLSTTNLAAAQATVTGTPMTLVSASGSGITVLSSATSFWPLLIGSSAISAGCVIDSVPTPLAFGASKQRTGMYDRTKMIGRNIRITGNAGAAAGNFTVRGYDVYGAAMTETIAHAGGATTASGLKAFKVVVSVTPDFTDAGHTFSLGTGDVYGFPLQCPLFSDVQIFWNNALITSATGFTVPDTTDPATATTGDVRGTYAVQTASDNAKRLVVRIWPSLSLVNTNPTTGLLGVAQYSG